MERIVTSITSSFSPPLRWQEADLLRPRSGKFVLAAVLSGGKKCREG